MGNKSKSPNSIKRIATILINKSKIKGPFKNEWYAKTTRVYHVHYIDIGDAIAKALGYDLEEYGYIMSYANNCCVIAFVPKDAEELPKKEEE